MLLRMAPVSLVTLVVAVLLWPANVSARTAESFVVVPLSAPQFPRNFVRLTSYVVDAPMFGALLGKAVLNCGVLLGSPVVRLPARTGPTKKSL